MIGLQCECGATVERSEGDTNRAVACDACGRSITCVSAEQLADGAGAGDFDARLVVKAGPGRVGEIIALGGCAVLGIGKRDENPIVLAGTQVSRVHCRLERVDFGPSRWKLVDNKSTNGVFVNGRRVTAHELRNGDVVRVGEYEMEYRIVGDAGEFGDGALEHAAALEALPADGAVAAAPPMLIDAPVAPSGGAASRAIENASRFVPITLLPAPLPHTAGPTLPLVAWAVAGLVLLGSILFFFAFDEEGAGHGRELMLIPPKTEIMKQGETRMRQMERGERPATPRDYAPAAAPAPRPATRPAVAAATRPAVATATRPAVPPVVAPAPAARPDEIADEATQKEETLKAMKRLSRDLGEPQIWQAITHVFIHDNSSVLSCILQIVVNVLFLLAFASLVNALAGHIVTGAAMLLFAIAATVTYRLAIPTDAVERIRMAGASGVVCGLAGMYLILFFTHNAQFALWLRAGEVKSATFGLPGVVVVVAFLAFDAVILVMSGSMQVYVWVHLACFLLGLVAGVGLALSRLFPAPDGCLIGGTRTTTGK